MNPFATNATLVERDWNKVPVHLDAMDIIDTPMVKNGQGSPQFTAYDVLLMPSNDDILIHFAPGHIGNQRFKVLLSLYNQKYIQAETLGNEYECFRIAYEIMETVCRKCVPNGRFFEHSYGGQWCEMELGLSTINMIRSALRTPPMINDDDHQNPKRAFYSSSGCMELYEVAKKSEDFVTSPNPFDVLCEESGLLLQKDDHVGNNRLKVLFNIHMKTYKVSDEEGKKQIAHEVVSSIIDDASCRFLQLDMSAGMYKPMAREAAVICMKLALDAASSVKNGEKARFGASEVKKLINRKHKKAVLDRFEHRKILDILQSDSQPPVSFKSLKQKNSMASQAA